MTDEITEPESPTPDDEEIAGRRPTLDMIAEAAESVRRIEGKDDRDAEGLRTIWHRGRNRVELLTWENEQEEVVRQELSIFGMVVEFRRGESVRTGNIPLGGEDSAGDAKPMSAMVEMQDVPDPSTLEFASHLLKNIKDRDQYAQNLLRLVNLCIAELGYDDGQTAVSGVAKFSRQGALDKTQPLNPDDLEQQRTIRAEARRAPPMAGAPLDQTKIMTVEKGNNAMVILLAVALGLAGVGLGLLVSYFLGVL